MGKAYPPLGHGKITWLGVNQDVRGFSTPRERIFIAAYGVANDRYYGQFRTMNGHDVDYITTDGVARDTEVINHRQITIVEQDEVAVAGILSGTEIMPGMLRENMVVQYASNRCPSFSRLPPLCRMVIGTEHPKVLMLTETNQPCRGICNPIAAFLQKPNASEPLRQALKNRRGQLAMARTVDVKEIHLGDTFMIYPPMDEKYL